MCSIREVACPHSQPLLFIVVLQLCYEEVVIGISQELLQYSGRDGCIVKMQREFSPNYCTLFDV